ncbi:MAG: guanine deaminase, partial [Actinomycetia bacterium]|nr:guanine deaminase [Actinomycetes bacterium]
MGDIRIREEALVLVDASGYITAVVESDDVAYERAYASASAGEIVELTESQYLLPGLVDLHIHAPQWPQLGKA